SSSGRWQISVTMMILITTPIQLHAKSFPNDLTLISRDEKLRLCNRLLDELKGATRCNGCGHMTFDFFADVETDEDGSPRQRFCGDCRRGIMKSDPLTAAAPAHNTPSKDDSAKIENPVGLTPKSGSAIETKADAVSQSALDCPWSSGWVAVQTEPDFVWRF